MLLTIWLNILLFYKDLNGKISFGKYVAFDKINVSCLDTIGEKDLAMMLIEDIDKLYIEDIAEKVSFRAKKIKSDDGFIV